MIPEMKGRVVIEEEEISGTRGATQNVAYLEVPIRISGGVGRGEEEAEGATVFIRLGSVKKDPSEIRGYSEESHSR